jgi:hypothetical protein
MRMKRSWPNLISYPTFGWMVWRRPRKTCQDTGSPRQDLKPGHPEYEVRVLTTRPRCSGIFMGWEHVSELLPLTDILFISQTIYEYEERRWNDIDRKNEAFGDKPVPVTLCPTRIDPGTNQGLRGEMPATNRLSHDTAHVRSYPQINYTVVTASLNSLQSILPHLIRHQKNSVVNAASQKNQMILRLLAIWNIFLICISMRMMECLGNYVLSP